jgi:hypothetical protein
MKCTVCGAEMGEETICSRCGKKGANSPDKLEVNYKDFKISEFLEIRSKPGSYKAVEKGVEPSVQENADKSSSGKRKGRLYLLIPLLIIVIFFIVYLVRR